MKGCLFYFGYRVEFVFLRLYGFDTEIIVITGSSGIMQHVMKALLDHQTLYSYVKHITSDKGDISVGKCISTQTFHKLTYSFDIQTNQIAAATLTQET